MPFQEDIMTLAPGRYYWTRHDPEVKADLSSSAIEAEAGLFLIDPIPLPENAPFHADNVAGIVVTNGNHRRAAMELSRRFAAPVFVHQALCSEPEFAGAIATSGSATIDPEIEIIAIEGAAAGEIVLRHKCDGGGLIVGDALINFEPHGFSFLPSKYCSNPRAMRRSLRGLLDHTFDWMLFAHGTPVLKGARRRLESLFE